ncbi:MAG: hypothetical protein HGA37_16025 [Lentimicrobium sp.]|nr:hypothetical protein [Lentimicrobium sp.]
MNTSIVVITPTGYFRSILAVIDLSALTLELGEGGILSVLDTNIPVDYKYFEQYGFHKQLQLRYGTALAVIEFSGSFPNKGNGFMRCLVQGNCQDDVIKLRDYIHQKYSGSKGFAFESVDLDGVSMIIEGVAKLISETTVTIMESPAKAVMAVNKALAQLLIASPK